MPITFNIFSETENKQILFSARHVIIAGWAGRDKDAMEHHIRELEALGIARPKELPTFYHVSTDRLTTQSCIQATGSSTSGEVEPVILACNGQLYVGVGSDHTDRELEAHGVTVSKQICEKPLSTAVWSYEEVSAHWDQLVLRSYIHEEDREILYQEGTLAALLHPMDTIHKYLGSDANLDNGTVLFCGTIPAKGGVRPSSRFSAILEDPVLARSLRIDYSIEALPVAD